ncbi:TolC family outer membrane protein [Vibrio tritonius]|uniref:TolC family outer membrane protein n=2 Tax=Vibrio tritonius TaxID=1435069 RepID=A0ABS7YMT0_9VIBR|nr:TolC family outer membrane protein [Vibrio tritonius]MCA2015575.1 TolC family outer membrane protein [Vibrio tritonius]
MLLFMSNNIAAQTLEQAVAFTLTNNPEVLGAYNQFKSTEYTAKASTGSYLPTIDLDGGVGPEHIRPSTSSGDEKTSLTRKDLTLSINQLIWDGSATYNDIYRTQAEAEADRYQLLSDASNKALEVTQIYLNATEAEEVLKLSERNLATHQAIFVDIKKKSDSGIGSIADVTQIEARVAKAQANLLAAKNNLYDIYAQYFRLIGLQPKDLNFPRADMSVIPETVSKAIEQSQKHHPEIKVARSDVEAAQYQYKQSKGPNYPTVSLEANQSWYDDVGGTKGFSQETSVMLRFRYNLFSGGSDKDTITSSAYQVNRAKDLQRNTIRNVEEGLHLAWNALEITKQQKDFLQQHIDAVSKTVSSYRKQYSIGQRTLLDLLNTENELFEARTDYLEAKYAEQYAKYRVMNAMGILLESLRVDLPSEWLKESD